MKSVGLSGDGVGEAHNVVEDLLFYEIVEVRFFKKWFFYDRFLMLLVYLSFIRLETVDWVLLLHIYDPFVTVGLLDPPLLFLHWLLHFHLFLSNHKLITFHEGTVGSSLRFSFPRFLELRFPQFIDSFMIVSQSCKRFLQFAFENSVTKLILLQLQQVSDLLLQLLDRDYNVLIV